MPSRDVSCKKAGPAESVEITSYHGEPGQCSSVGPCALPGDDPVAERLAAALGAWKSDHDARMLRRCLFNLLQSLDQD